MPKGMTFQSSLSSCRHVLKLEIIGPVPRLCKFKLYAVIIKSLAADHRHAVVIFHINIFFINLGHMFDSERPLARRNRNSERSFNVFIDI